MNWDDVISNESQFVLLPDGIYDFTVTKFEKGWYDGSEKIEPCPKAVLELTIEAPEGKTTVKEELKLSTVVEWKLCEFFRSIGQKQHGQQFRMDWNKVLGAKGKVKIKVHEYTGNDGSQKKTNKVVSFIDAPSEKIEPNVVPDEVNLDKLPWE